MIIHGDSLERLRTLNAESIDALVTDPPYGLSATKPQQIAECLQAWSTGERWTPSGRGFMNKSWDAFVPPPELWREVFRVMKSGAHGLVFAGTRTQDLMSVSLRLAGFEVRDTLMWVYGSGFPKSHNVALSIDKMQGHPNRGRAIPVASRYQASDTEETHKLTSNRVEAYEGKSERSEEWAGWGTALKPAYEPVILIRKPLRGTVAQTVLENGTGALNINATRIALGEGDSKNTSEKTGSMNRDCDLGRWPANVLFDSEAAEMLDAQSGGASRFFYTSKASKKEREAGLMHREVETRDDGRQKPIDTPYLRGETERKNTHPTVKPLDLMRYLVRLITPPNGVILDPFAGSGSTLCAAVQQDFNYIGIEREAEYVEIARARVEHWKRENESRLI